MDSEIDFEKEIAEFLKDNLIKSFMIIDKQLIDTKIKIITLENYEILMTCSVTKGIEINEANFPLNQKKFDSFEQILTMYSKEYIKTFNEGINNRLASLLAKQLEERDDENQQLDIGFDESIRNYRQCCRNTNDKYDLDHFSCT